MATNVLVVSTSSFYVDFYRYLDDNGISDVKVVAAVDPVENKGEKDLGQLALGKADGVPVLRSLKGVSALDADVMLLYLPPSLGVEDYVAAALQKGQALINMGMQSTQGYVDDFRKRGLPLAGDYAIEQLSPSVVLDSLINLLKENGLSVGSSYQIGAGGPDLDEVTRERRRQDELSLIKEKQAVFMGAVEPVDFMGDRRHYYSWIEAEGPLKSSVQIDLWVKYEEAPLLCAPALELIRGIARAKNEGLAGPAKQLMHLFKRPVA
ncbi:MAG: hypothetical protein ACP5SK_00710 [Thermoprotei archaeon]